MRVHKSCATQGLWLNVRKKSWLWDARIKWICWQWNKNSCHSIIIQTLPQRILKYIFFAFFPLWKDGLGKQLITVKRSSYFKLYLDIKLVFLIYSFAWRMTYGSFFRLQWACKKVSLSNFLVKQNFQPQLRLPSLKTNTLASSFL